MASRRHSKVPVYEWRKAFAEVQHNLAQAIRALDVSPEEAQKEVPKYALVLRLAANKLFLSELKNKLAEHPGIETAEEIKKYAIEAIQSVLSKWDTLRDFYRKMLKSVLEYQGINPNEVNLDKYMEYLREVLSETAKLLAASTKTPVAAATA